VYLIALCVFYDISLIYNNNNKKKNDASNLAVSIELFVSQMCWPFADIFWIHGAIIFNGFELNFNLHDLCLYASSSL
jgi:hypothetical protein